MPSLLIDEDWSKVDPQAARALGYTGVIGYVSQDTTGKNLTRADVDAIHAAGMSVGLVYEYNPKSALGGHTQALKDGMAALLSASYLQVPRMVALYAAVDWDVQPQEMSSVASYLAAYSQLIHNNGFRSGVYGGYNVCNAPAVRVNVDFLWQTYAWSGGRWAEPLAVRQVRNGVHVAGAVVDQDETSVADWGQWAPSTIDSLLKGDTMIIGTDGNQKYLCDGMRSRPITDAQATTIIYLAGQGAYQLTSGKPGAEWESTYVRKGWDPTTFGLIDQPQTPGTLPADAVSDLATIADFISKITH